MLSTLCIRVRRIIALVALAWALPITPSLAQDAGLAAPRAVARPESARPTLDSLVRLALVSSPRIRAEQSRVDAARARISPAAARPDPMLMAGLVNVPISREDRPPPDPHGGAAPADSLGEMMTMKMVGVSQMLPYPGKLSLRRRAAERELDGARAELERITREVARDIKTAYYDIAYLDRALEIVERNRLVLLDVIKAAEVRYAAGTGSQQDLLRARVEAARLGEEAAALHEERLATLARLNSILDLATETPLDSAAIPARVWRAAVADSAANIRFASPTLGSRAADSPLPPLAELQTVAVEHSPMLRARAAKIAAQSARAELAGKEHLPDFDVTLSYGQRDGFSDMITATLSVPIPVQRGRKQRQLVAESRAELSALEAEQLATINDLRAEVARLHSELERDRAQLALYVKAILPQSRAALESAVASYQVGRADFLVLLDAQTTLFNYETAFFRVLTGFARTLAEMEQVAGREVLR